MPRKINKNIQKKIEQYLNEIINISSILIEDNKSQDKDINDFLIQINSIKNNLNQIEKNIEIKNNIIYNSDCEDVKIKNKLYIKNRKYSKSFASWLFNNKEL